MKMNENITKRFNLLLVAVILLSASVTTCLAQEKAVLTWAAKFGGTGADRSRDMVADAAGNTYITGYYSGTVDFDPGAGVSNLTAAGSSDIFISKLDANGHLVWAKSVGGTGGDSPMAIAIDANSNVYITGGFVGTADFDPGPGVFNMTSAGQTDIYIAKYDASGNFVWAKGIIGGTWFDHGYGILVDGTGNVHVIGRFYYQGGARDFDPGPGTFFLTADWEDIFILKLDNDGNFIWAKDIGNVLESRGHSIALDATGNVYTTGYFLGTVDFDPGAGTFNLTSVGGSTGWDIFYSKLDANGNFVWAKAMVNSTSTYYTDGYYGRKIAVDASGNVYSSGRYSGTTDFDFGTGTFNLTPAGGYDAYLMKMSTDGDFVWAKSFGGTGYDEGFSLCLGTTGDVYLTGFFVNTVDFDPGTGTFNLSASGANDDIFVSKFDSNGNFVWAGSMGGTLDDQGYGISTDASGNVYLSGWFQSTADFDPGACTVNQTSAGADDAFIVKLNQIVRAPLSVTSVSPAVGVAGNTITITGTGFSTTPADNTVTFNSTAAVVTASTATSITVTVPAVATTGKISVTTDCVTANSSSDFIVTDNFVTQWNLATAGSGATQLTFGTSTSGNVNYTWQEISPGTASGSGSWSGATLTITGLPTGATIRLLIAPANFQRIIINNGADRNRLTQVEQWGTTAWTSMQSAFRNCLNLQITATDIPNLTGVSNMSEMFSGCDILNSPGNIGSWNTGAVTTMQRMFANTDAFNQNIGAWNTSAVTNMSEMFSSARAFNQPIGGWNTAVVTNMSGMFFFAEVFNQDIGAWNTSAVTDMSDMFTEAYAFNQNIGAWNTAAVTNMSNMFSEAIAFNQDISSWNTSAVTNMSGMFKFASIFNQNIGAWNTAAVTTMSQMFSRASAFNQNVSSWNTGAVTSMLGMFEQATAFNQNIGAWTLNPGVDLRFMFDNNGLDCNNYSATLIGWSANASTPNGRSLGANERQYGTNAAAARAALAATKSWTITGDTPSGVACAPVPGITGFTPASGPVGTTVTITGINFSTTPASNIVQFNGVAAVVSSSTANSITVVVPAGATTGKISVTVDGMTATSANDFTVTTTANQPPVISSTTASVPINGVVTVELLSLLSDPDDNLDLSTLALVNNTSEQGAAASINASSELILDYGSVIFIGVDRVSIEVCDLLSACSQQVLSIEVEGDIVIYNAVSPNGDDKNEILRIANIQLFAKNHVSVFNRWGDLVFEADNYNNDDRVFKGLNKNGNELPAGIYYYKIELSGGKTQTGYLSLRR